MSRQKVQHSDLEEVSFSSKLKGDHVEFAAT